MIPQEEYFKRHSLDLLEVSHTLSSGSLLLKVDPSKFGTGCRWVLVTVSWVDPIKYPGSYSVKIESPTHNAASDGRSVGIFEHLYGYPPRLVVQYDELSRFFRAFAKEFSGSKPITDAKDIMLSTWEIFLYCWDEQISNISSGKLRSYIESSLDLDLRDADRFFAYADAVDCLMSEQPSLFSCYETYVHALTQRSLNWLARLVIGA